MVKQRQDSPLEKILRGFGDICTGAQVQVLGDFLILFYPQIPAQNVWDFFPDSYITGKYPALEKNS